MSAKYFFGLALTTAFFGSLAPTATAQHGTTYVEHHHSSTFEESLMYGRAKILRDYGAGFRDMAEGQKALAEAQRRYLENRRLALLNYYESKQLYASYRASKRERPSTADDFERRAKAMAPRRLSQAELSTTGSIQWPMALCESQRDHARQSIEAELRQLFAESEPARVMQLRRSLVARCGSLKDSLRARLREFSTNDYVVASKFIDSLRNEVQQAHSLPTVDQVASR